MVASRGENALNHEPSCSIKLKHTDSSPLETEHIIRRVQRHESVLSVQKESSAHLIFLETCFSAQTRLENRYCCINNSHILK